MCFALMVVMTVFLKWACCTGLVSSDLRCLERIFFEAKLYEGKPISLTGYNNPATPFFCKQISCVDALWGEYRPCAQLKCGYMLRSVNGSYPKYNSWCHTSFAKKESVCDDDRPLVCTDCLFCDQYGLPRQPLTL